jgi:glutaredoxin 3
MARPKRDREALSTLVSTHPAGDRSRPLAKPMTHNVEVFTAGCPACDAALRSVREIVGVNETAVRDMRLDTTAQRRAKELGIHRVPAVVVDGTVVRCCDTRPIDPAVIRSLLAER